METKQWCAWVVFKTMSRTVRHTLDCPQYLLFRINAVDAAYRITITTKGHWDVVLLVTADDQLRVGI